MSQNHLSFLKSLFGDNEESRRKILRSFKAKIDAKRTWSEKTADWMTSSFGSMKFLFLNIVFFILWLLVNTGYLNFIPAFDPFPFNLLTTFVSLEAIILAVFVLISQKGDGAGSAVFVSALQKQPREAPSSDGAKWGNYFPTVSTKF